MGFFTPICCLRNQLIFLVIVSQPRKAKLGLRDIALRLSETFTHIGQVKLKYLMTLATNHLERAVLPTLGRYAHSRGAFPAAWGRLLRMDFPAPWVGSWNMAMVVKCLGQMVPSTKIFGSEKIRKGGYAVTGFGSARETSVVETLKPELMPILG